MPTALSLQSLRKTYDETVAVDDLSLEVETGEIFGLIGPNGAGKTTAVECTLGLRQPDSGTVQVLGMDPQQASPSAFYRRVGAQLQEAALPDRITVREALTLFASFYPATTDHDALLDRWGLAGKRDAAFSALSGGQKQRLFVALALVHDPDLVVLDEISTGLDPEARRGTRALLREVQAAGTTVILVTHFMDEAQALCDRVAMMHQGRCVALDSPEALIDRLDASYRVRFAAPPAFDPTPLRALAGVKSVTVDGDRVAVRGGDDLLTTVVHTLSEQGISPDDLYAERATLEDVFLTLTDDPSTAALHSSKTAPPPEPKRSSLSHS